MTSILDIIISVIFAGALTLIALNANTIAQENLQETQATIRVQQDLTSVIQLLEGEFRNAGSGLAQAQSALVRAESTAIGFIGDVDGDPATVDTITYELGYPSELSDTPNALDRPLYRTLRGSPRLLAGVLTVLRFRYFDAARRELSVPVPTYRLSEIHLVEVTAEVQNSYAVELGTGESIYPSSMWQQTRLATRNSQR